MSTGEGTQQPQPPRRARRREQAGPPANINPPATNPTARLDAMTQGRIDSLEGDKTYYRVRAERLQDEVNRLGSEVARLREMVKSAGVLDFASLVLIGLGGGIISYATFVPSAVSSAVANSGLGSLLAGIFLLLILNIYRWSKL